MARPKKRPRVGTILGTEDRNDDETIARTPRLAFDVRTPNPTPNETTTTVERVSPLIPTDGGGSGDRNGGGSGDDGRSDIEGSIAPAATQAESTLGVPTPEDDLFNDPDIAEMAARSRGTVAAGIPGLPDPVAEVDVKSPAEANATATKGTVNDPDYSYAPAEEYAAAADATGGAVGDDTMGTNDQSYSSGETHGGSGTDSGVGDGSPGGDTGGGAGVGDGGIGGPGDPSGSPGSGAFDKGGEIEGEDPAVDGEIVTSTFKEGEMVLVEDVKDAIGKKKLDRANKIALRKDLSRQVKQRQIKRTIAS